VIAWTPGIGLETTVAGVGKPAINDKAFDSAVFRIWLGDKPVQDDIKKDLVARGAELLK
jgi:chalcone isomerase-like protein